MTDILRSVARRIGGRRLVAPSLLAVGLLLILIATVEPAAAQTQASQLGRQGLGRAYWHVFASYAIAWVLIFGWILAMFRRLRRIEERLTDAE